MKECSYCKEIKSTSEFGKCNQAKDRLQYHCKSCHTIQSNKSLCKRKKRLLFRPVNGRLTAAPEKYIHRSCNVCGSDYIPTQSNNIWCSICSEVAATNVFRSLRIKTDPAVVTDVTRRYIKETSCCYCGREFTEENYKSIDHVLPVAKGGTNIASNIAICCWQCNASKAALTVEEWIALCKLVIKQVA